MNIHEENIIGLILFYWIRRYYWEREQEKYNRVTRNFSVRKNWTYISCGTPTGRWFTDKERTKAIRAFKDTLFG